jgi:cytochrome b
MEKQTVKVWDLAVRVGHLAMGVLVLGAFLTAEDDGRTPLHTRLGLALLGVVLFRLVWGFVGSRHARFADFVRSPREVKAYLRQYVQGRPGAHLGHNPLGGVMVVALLTTLAVVTLTGLVIAMGPEWDGPLAGLLTKGSASAVKEVHEVSAWLLPVLVAFHVAGVTLSSFLEKQNLLAGMVTGYKRAPEGLPAAEPSRWARTLGFVAAAGLSAGAVLALWKVLPVGTAEAATPAPLAAEYLAEARAATPGFTPDVARGKALYVEEHVVSGAPTSCATCHTSDPRSPGKSPVGKRIDALSPSVNPDRFTDRKKADRWFDRNCKQVLSRPCTPAEKSDFVAYVTSL